MSVMVQVRNVPEPLHRRLKARAAMAGMSLSDYVLSELERSLETPTRAEILARLALLPRVETDEPAAATLRRDRGRR